jgi:hypothetical protein
MRVSLLLAALAALAGCPATGDEVRPPDDQIFFPTGMAGAPDESVLFVINGNSDLRYDSGSVSAVDLAEADELVDAWLADREVPDGRDCEISVDVPYTLVCNEREALVPDAGVRIGNFGTEIAAQLLDDGRLRLFAAVRGDPSITWIDYDPGERDLACGDEGAGFPECDDDHRLVRLRDDVDLLDLPDEPFGIWVDSVDGFAVATHLSDGAVSLVDAPPDGSPPILADALGGLFASNPSTGARGAAGVAGRLPGSSPDRIYVTSRSEARVQTLSIAWPHGTRAQGGLPAFVPTDYFFMNKVLPSDDARGIRFSEDGARAYIVNRDPAMLQIFDTSMGPGGRPRDELVRVVEVCQQASNLAVADQGEGERVYVACFRAGQLWVIDPASAAVEAILDVGRGPNAVAAAPGRGKVYVTNFLEDTIAVVDVRPGSSTENRVVLRLGRPRQEGGD